MRHGHVQVNGKRVTIPSYRVREGDVVSLKPSSAEHVSSSAATSTPSTARCRCGWSRRRAALRCAVTSLPEREHIDEPLRESLIVELYSK